MKEMLTDIAKALVSQPDSVCVTEQVSGSTYILTLTVAKEDMGRVIGHGGKIAKSIRTLMRAAAIKEEKRVIVEIAQ